MPVRIMLSQGQSSDKTVAPPLIEAVEPGRDLVADRGYDARAVIDLVESRGGRAHIRTHPVKTTGGAARADGRLIGAIRERQG
ncbi:transposase [Bradyrhizobium sp. SZCCHNRI3052]